MHSWYHRQCTCRQSSTQRPKQASNPSARCLAWIRSKFGIWPLRTARRTARSLATWMSSMGTSPSQPAEETAKDRLRRMRPTVCCPSAARVREIPPPNLTIALQPPHLARNHSTLHVAPCRCECNRRRGKITGRNPIRAFPKGVSMNPRRLGSNTRRLCAGRVVATFRGASAYIRNRPCSSHP